MTEFRFTDVSQALPFLMAEVLGGSESGSRGGAVKEILHPHVVLTKPWHRTLPPDRKASLPAQIAETMWLLAGRDDVGWLSNYLPRAVDFSDDGKVWRGAYGKRLRSWRGLGLDQIAHVVDLLLEDPLTRRAVMAIYDPSIDSAAGKDIPCNDFIQFQQRNGLLHMHVFIRSNDLMWGWSGINAFEWSAVQEIVAGLTGFRMGELHFSISNLHLYERHWARAGRLAELDVYQTQASPRFELEGTLVDFDNLVSDWFALEMLLREDLQPGLKYTIHNFPEPMLRSWLQVIAWWWSQDESFLQPLAGSGLFHAAHASPRTDPVVQAPVELRGETGPELEVRGAGTTLPFIELAFPGRMAPGQQRDPFIEFVVNLHAEKSAVYGDSWKRRGEQGILGNIARKIDRLGKNGAGDTATDTAVDLLVYLVLYSLWIVDREGDQDSQVAKKLRSLHSNSTPIEDVGRQLEWLTERFESLESATSQGVSPSAITQDMIMVTAAVARRLWTEEQDGARIDAWQAGNATRSWNPDPDSDFLM